MTVMPSVYVQGKFANLATKRIFQEHHYPIIDVPGNADIIVWTGGEDIHPIHYGEQPISGCFYNKTRDFEDVNVAQQAIADKKICVGLCRGGQLLNIMNGGTLWQDVDGHNSGVHNIWDTVTGDILVVNTVHHQMMKPSPIGDIIAYAREATYKRAHGKIWKLVDNLTDLQMDPEVVFYENTKSLCVQFHPEFGHKPTTDYFFDLMDRCYQF